MYTSPLTSVNTNNIRSKYFNLSCGTRQGCPLYPLLFAICLSASHDLPTTHLFRYFQIRHCVLKTFFDFPSPPPRQPWEDLFKLQPNQRSLVSNIYRGLLFNTEQCSKSAAAWEQELGVQFEEDFWERAINRIRNSSSCGRLGLIQSSVKFKAIKNIPRH